MIRKEKKISVLDAYKEPVFERLLHEDISTCTHFTGFSSQTWSRFSITVPSSSLSSPRLPSKKTKNTDNLVFLKNYFYCMMFFYIIDNQGQ